jgi:F-type H+-transporting ATPase subunit epsilon
MTMQDTAGVPPSSRHFFCSFESFETLFFQGEVAAVHLPALDGDLTLFPGHAPLMTVLRSGFVRLVQPEARGTLAFSLSSGFAHVTPRGIKILAREACVFEESKPHPFPTQPLFFEGVSTCGPKLF